MKKALLILIQVFVFFFAANGNEEFEEDTALFFDKPIAKSMEISRSADQADDADLPAHLPELLFHRPMLSRGA